VQRLYLARELDFYFSRATLISEVTSKGKGVPMAGTLFGIFRQMRKGSWTNNPTDPNYGNHWKTARPPTEEVRQVLPGVAHGPGLFRTKQMVNVVVTPQNVYVDTPNVERVGPFGRVVGTVQDRSGLSAPQYAPLEQTWINRANYPDRQVVHAPSLPPITVRPNAYIGRPADLSWRGQLKNLWDMRRG
jgi:hypothetical protein